MAKLPFLLITERNSVFDSPQPPQHFCETRVKCIKTEICKRIGPHEQIGSEAAGIARVAAQWLSKQAAEGWKRGDQPLGK